MHPTLTVPEMEKIGIPRKISSISLYDQANLSYAQDSILPSISKFINTINSMSQIIMVPSKLHDFECEESDLNDTKSVSSDDSSSLSGSSSVSSNLLNLANSNTDNPLSNGSTTLYDSYRMLMQVKEDLLWGFKDQKLSQSKQNLDQNNNQVKNEEKENKDEKEEKDDFNDNQIINQFRSNVQQLNTLLNNFSEMAEFLTNKYQTVYEN